MFLCYKWQNALGQQQAMRMQREWSIRYTVSMPTMGWCWLPSGNQTWYWEFLIVTVEVTLPALAFGVGVALFQETHVAITAPELQLPQLVHDDPGDGDVPSSAEGG